MNETTDARIESNGGGRFSVKGALTFTTVPHALRSAERQFASDSALEIDLGGVVNADSAGLALLIEWYRQAARAKKSIRFVGVPNQLRALAKISDVDRLLAFDGASAG